MKCFELDVLALIPEHIHHHLQICLIGNIARHHIKVRAVKQNLAKELKRLALGDIVRRKKKGGE